ncbi:MAG TPA: restriction endonuclease subunit S [Blastocatellia bacterium]
MMTLPKDWHLGSVSDFVDALDAGVSLKCGDEPAGVGDIGVLKVSCVSSGCFRPSENKKLPTGEEPKTREWPRQGRILISRCNTRALVGVSAYVEEDYPDLRLPDKLWQTTYRTEVTFSPRWLAYALQAPYARSLLGRLASGTSGSMKNLSKATVMSLPVPVPPMPEQRKIGEILRTWDNAIAKLICLLTAKVSLKEVLAAKLLADVAREVTTGKVRLATFALPTLRARPKPMCPFKGLGLRSHCKGTFLKHDVRPETVGASELYEVFEGDLIVNITFAWEGAIAIATRADDHALVSHRFPTYVFDTGVILPGYFRQVMTQKWFLGKLLLLSPGGAGRNRVLSKKEFESIEVMLPTIEAQQRVASTLAACEREIELLTRQLQVLRRQKKGLMQKLLTGELRVKVEGAEGEGGADGEGK